MILENFLKDSYRVEQLKVAIEYLERCGIHYVLMELSVRKSPPPTAGANVLETQAFRAVWRDGYQAALIDLFDFFSQNSSENKKTENPVLDFGAIGKLLKDGTISEDEAKTMREEMRKNGNITSNHSNNNE